MHGVACVPRAFKSCNVDAFVARWRCGRLSSFEIFAVLRRSGCFTHSGVWRSSFSFYFEYLQYFSVSFRYASLFCFHSSCGLHFSSAHYFYHFFNPNITKSTYNPTLLALLLKIVHDLCVFLVVQAWCAVMRCALLSFIPPVSTLSVI